MAQTRFDTLIVGQGLAGSALAWHLLQAGQRVCVIDDGHRSASSIVAAGLINPLAGMRFSLRPRVADCLLFAERWYDMLGERLNRPLLQPLPMLRLFRSLRQQRFHRRLEDHPGSRGLVGDTFAPDACPEPVRAPFGAFLQYRTGYVDLRTLLTVLRDWLGRRGALLETALDHAALEPHTDGVRLGGIEARRLVFCDGARLRENPWFDWLPLTPTKGEILDLALADWQPRHIVNGAHWLLPVDRGVVRLGATHDHRRLDDQVTAQGRQQLLEGLARLRPGTEYTVTGHRAGLRPNSRDHYPLLGRHPAQPALWVCNGFGARGALIIPWYSRRLADHLLRGTALPAEADIGRWR